MMATRKIVTKYKWKIDKFSERMLAIERGDSISSDIFSLKGNSKAKFLINLYVYYGDCTFRLVCKDFGRTNKVDLNLKFWQENAVGVIEKEPEVKLSLSRASTTGDLNSKYSLYSMKPYVIDDVLFICCEIEHEEPASKFYESDSEDEKEELAMRSEFGQKLLKLHSEGHFDLTIKVGGKEFKAFKCILMACSEVFHRMLTCPNSIEAKTGIVKIKNTKPEVVDALIRWVYQVEVGNMNEIAAELYQVSDKYAIVPLKKKCVKLMIKSLSKENLMTLLILAYQHNEDKLKQHIIEFLNEDNKNLATLMTSDEWFKLGSENLEEAKKIATDIFA